MRVVPLLVVMFLALLAGQLVSNHVEASTVSSVKVYLNQRLLAMVVQYSLPFILSQLPQLAIPDQHFGAIGIDIYLTNIKLHDINLSNDNIQLIPSDSLQIQLTGLSLTATMDWEYKNGPLIDFHGSADDHISDTTFSLKIEVGSDGKGNPTAQITNTDINIGSLDITMHGDGGQFFQFIANVAKDLLKKTLQDKISGAITDSVNKLITNALADFHPYVPITNHTSVYFGLISSNSLHGMTGQHYNNNHFGGGSSSISLKDELNGRINVPAYHSYEVSGQMMVPKSGKYQVRLQHNQRGQVQTEGMDAGSLELWNVGMCWTNEQNEYTGFINMEAGKFYPLNLKFQSGCGGGWFQVYLCDEAHNCNSLGPLDVFTSNTAETPINVYNNYVLLSTSAEVLYDGNEVNLPRHLLPNDPSSDDMISIAIDEYVVNSLFFALAKENILHYYLTADQIPASVPLRLNTATFKYLLTDLYNTYPDYDMSLNISLADGQLPELDINPDTGLSLFAPVSLTLNTIDKKNNNTVVNTLGLDLTLVAQVMLAVNDTTNVIVGEISVPTFKIAIRDFNKNIFTNVTELDHVINDMLTPSLTSVVTEVLQPILNSMLAKGFPVPHISIVQFTNAKITYLPSSVLISTDIDINFMQNYVTRLMTTPYQPLHHP